MIKYLLPQVFLITLTLISFTMSTSAKVPNVINYQGKVTDPSGDPVADDTYSMVFSIYDNLTGGNMLWSESHSSVTVTGGLFSVKLGTDFPIAAGILNESEIYLNITIGADDIVPRTRIIAAPYAIRAEVADSLENDIYLNANGDTLSGILYLGNAGIGGHIEITNNYANLFLATNDSIKTHIYGDLYGEMFLYDNDGTPTVDLSAHHSTGGELELYDTDGYKQVGLYAGAGSNDLKVNFPDDAINSDEIINEPGLAHGSAATVSLSTSWKDIATVDINVPAAGYVYVISRSDVYINSTVDNGITMSIYSASDSTVINWLGYTNSIADQGLRQPTCIDGIFYCSDAGPYTFVLEGYRMDASGSAYAMNVTITALYFPTSYAAVTALVNDPAGFPNAVPVPVYDHEGNPTGETRYEVDLRYYELKAKKAKIKFLEAELELERARKSENR